VSKRFSRPSRAIASATWKFTETPALRAFSFARSIAVGEESMPVAE